MFQPMPRRLQVLTRTAGRVAGAQQRRGSGERHHREDDGELPLHDCFLSSCLRSTGQWFCLYAFRGGQGTVNNAATFAMETRRPPAAWQPSNHVVTGSSPLGRRLGCPPSVGWQLIAATNFFTAWKNCWHNWN